MTTRILRLPQVTEKTGYGRSAIWEKANIGEFPKPVRLGPRAVGWVEAEVDDWIAARIAKRDQVAA